MTSLGCFFVCFLLFLQVRCSCGLKEAAIGSTYRWTAKREDVLRNVMRGGGSTFESNWRIYFLCVGRLRDTSVLLAEERPDNLNTTSTTNCYSISEHRLTAAIQRLSPPQLHSYSAKLDLSSVIRTPAHSSVWLNENIFMSPLLFLYRDEHQIHSEEKLVLNYQ